MKVSQLCRSSPNLLSFFIFPHKGGISPGFTGRRPLFPTRLGNQQADYLSLDKHYRQQSGPGVCFYCPYCFFFVLKQCTCKIFSVSSLVWHICIGSPVYSSLSVNVTDVAFTAFFFFSFPNGQLYEAFQLTECALCLRWRLSCCFRWLILF